MLPAVSQGGEAALQVFDWIQWSLELAVADSRDVRGV